MQKIDFQQMVRARGMRLADVARGVGVDKGTVTRWAQRGIPQDRVLEVERVTGISRHALRPDLAAIFGSAA